MVWHPRSGEVLGIYQDGNVFKWHPSESSSQEANEVTTALTCSSNGVLFATSDPNGLIKIWKYDEFVPIYQLRCEWPVADLAFSADNRRLYDLRGPFCNVWEPNALVRLSDLDKFGSEAASETMSTLMSSTMSEAEADMVSPITALAAGPGGEFYCSGNAEGVAKLYQSPGLRTSELWRSRNFMSIEQIAWSIDGRNIALRDLGGNVVVKELQAHIHPAKRDQWSHRTIFEVLAMRNNEKIEHLLLSPSSEYLLLAGQTSAQVWSVMSGSRLASWSSKRPNQAFRWINHPYHSDELLAIGAEGAFVCYWHDLVEKSAVSFKLLNVRQNPESAGKSNQIRRPSYPRSMSATDVGHGVDKVTLTQNGAYIMVETTQYYENFQSERQLMVFSKSAFDSDSDTLSPEHIPSSLLDILQLPLGVLPGDRFVFLDNNSWLCSWQLGSDDKFSGIDRYYFLPRDWVNAECLDLCLVVENGVLLIPKNGEVASIKSDLGLRW
ncbi:MAG: hypothetical protein Q9160_006723 [Pyrenula sp. 1 TL-2023]